MVKKFALGLTKKGVQEAKDFIDDVFPLGTFADKPYSRPAKEVSNIITKTGRDGTLRRIKYTGGKKLGVLQPGISRKASGTDSTGIMAEFSLKGKKYKKSFSEQKFDDALGDAREYIKQTLKNTYGDDVKILTNSEFLKLVKQNRGLTRVELAEKLKKLNYITNDQYIPIKENKHLQKYFQNFAENENVQNFAKLNPLASQAERTVLSKDFSGSVLSGVLYRKGKEAFAKMFPEEQKLVSALDEQARLFNDRAQTTAGLAGAKKTTGAAQAARPYSVDHVSGFERLKAELDMDTPALATYLRNKHNLFGPKYAENNKVFEAASKFYKTVEDRDEMLSRFMSEKMAANPNTEKLFFNHYGLDGIQMVKQAFHGTQKGGIHPKGASKTAWFEGINNTIMANTRAAAKSKKIKEGINNVLAVRYDTEKYKKAMLDAYKKTNDSIFDTVDDNFFDVYQTKLDVINKRQPVYIKAVEDAKIDAQRWLDKLPFEDRQAYVMDRIDNSLILTDARLPNPTINPYAKGGRVEMDEGGTAFDALIKQNQEEHGMELKDAIDEAIKEMLERQGYAEGGRVVPGGSQRTIGSNDQRTIGATTNKVGNIESMLAGIGAGIIDIPRGAFTLGAALMDMGLGTNSAAKVEKWFDELTDLDEKADATTIGGMVRLLTNLGIPGAQAWKIGTTATKQALLAKRNGNYFRITDPKLEERMKTALNGKGRLYATLGGAGAVGVSDAIFIGDVNKAGTMGDLFGGPTQLNENDANEASKEVMNRMKFGLDSSLMIGLIGGTGSAIKTAVKRRNDLASDNDALDRFLGKLRPRGMKPQEFFEMERANIGARAGDVNYAGEVARSLDKHIDAIFPFVINPFNKMGNNGRKEFMKELNDVLLSGKADIGVTGKFDFGDLDPEMVKNLTTKMKKMGAKQSDIDGVFNEFYNIRGGWGHMFSRLGAKMDKTNLDEFRDLFSKKFSNYLGSTYEIFQNKSIVPMLNYRPTEEAVNKAMVMFKQSAKEAGEEITDAQARHYVDKIVEGARLPSSPTSGLYLDVPDFFANRTILDDLGGKNKIGLEAFTPEAKKVFNEVLGKIEDPMQTVLAGTGRLSLIARRNEFYNDIVKRSADDIAAGNKGFFYDTEADAINALGSNVRKIEIDPSRTIEAGITNPINGKYAQKAVADAIEESAMVQRDKQWYTQMYDSFILYPKATSQIAKTILSPVTHVRNFVSAGAFAGANGLLPGVTVSPDKMAEAMKDAYRALQTNLPGSRTANDAYRDLLRLGVVNSNVRLGDLQRLLKDVQFGETLSAQTGLRGLSKQLSKVKKWTEDMYTAEDDFWKITSYALERGRLKDAYEKVGIKVTRAALDEEAASIVRNNIPNYDMVNEFVKGLRRLPFGNFVSFPAEIMRTTTNILGRALKEINYQHTLDDGRVVNPLAGIGYKRLFGLGATTVAVPYGVVEGAKALYDVSGAEMDALRRFVPEWSRNSTLVPIKDKETGELKYIDFSHANAYDTMIRPINTMINSVGKGIDEGEIMKNVAVGMFDATKETFSPFMSESIWTEAATDIIFRGGRTREGRRLYTEQTPWGEKVSLIAGHIAKTQVPGSVDAFKRLDLALEPVDIIQKGKYDKYGRTYELGDELLGLAGMRAVKVDPLRSMKFKIAEYRTGVNNARREFTTPLLRGGPIEPKDIIDRYQIANESLYKVNKNLFDDYYAARVLGKTSESIDKQFADRVSATQLNAIKTGRFKPFIPSQNIIKAFADNAREIGQLNPYRAAENQINFLAQKYNNIPLYGISFPNFENPFDIPSAPLPPQMTNVVPTAGLNTGSVVQTGMGGVVPVSNTVQRGQQVFGVTDTVFGS